MPDVPACQLESVTYNNNTIAVGNSFNFKLNRALDGDKQVILVNFDRAAFMERDSAYLIQRTDSVKTIDAYVAGASSSVSIFFTVGGVDANGNVIKFPLSLVSNGQKEYSEGEIVISLTD